MAEVGRTPVERPALPPGVLATVGPCGAMASVAGRAVDEVQRDKVAPLALGRQVVTAFRVPVVVVAPTVVVARVGHELLRRLPRPVGVPRP